MLPLDGPALTEDGRVLDLDGDCATYFSHDKESSPSHAAKSEAKLDAYMRLALHVAHEACEAEARINTAETCAIDEKGAVYGTVPLSPDEKRASAVRLKLFHDKVSSRKSEGYPSKLHVDAFGQVYPQEEEELSGAEVPFQKQVSIDSEGVVHAQDAMPGTPPLSPQNKCASPINLKRLHRKRLSRGNSGLDDDQFSIVSVDSDGIIRDRFQPDITPLIVPVAICAH